MTIVSARDRRLRCMVVATIIVALLGCAPRPMLQYGNDVPAQTLSVLGAPDIGDGRVRFREIFCEVLARQPDPRGRSCAELLHRLADEPPASGPARPLPAHDSQFALLFVPGLFSDCTKQMGLPFERSLTQLRALGYTAAIVPVSGRSSPAFNAAIIAEAVQNVVEGSGQRVVLIGHSKGAVDSLEFLTANPVLAAHVDAVVSVAGAINGSPLGEALSGTYKAFLHGVDISLCPRGDGGAFTSLRRSERLRWLRNHPLPEQVRYYSLAAFTSPDNMHFPLRIAYAALAEVDPRNDGQLLYFDQLIPGATLLGYANADHWAVAIPIQEKSWPTAQFLTGYFQYPRSVLMESLVLYLTEALAAGRSGE